MSATSSSSPPARILRRGVAVLSAVLAAGLLVTALQIRTANRHMRVELLQRATLIAWAFRADAVATLSGSEEDLASPAYERIKAQLQEARALYPTCRFLYIMRKQADGRLIFLVDSEPPDSEDYSPPGQPYDEATETFRRVFDTRRADTEGPVADRWGTWISAMVPLFDPWSEELVAVLGMDIDARQWRGLLLRHALPPLQLTVLLLLIAGTGLALLQWRNTRTTRRQGPSLWSIETFRAASFGLTLTAFAAYAAHTSENQAHREAFCRLAASQASLLQQTLVRIGDNYLEGLARFFDASDFVDRPEFHSYAGYLLNRLYAQSWEWIPEVTDALRDRFEQDVRAGGAPSFAVWEFDAQGEHVPARGRPVYYPVCYTEPPQENEKVLGYDLGSEPRRRAAMTEARRTGLATATDPIALIQRPQSTNGVVVFRPVYAKGSRTTLSGFAAVVLRMDALLVRALSRDSTKEESATHVDFFQVGSDRTAVWLAANEAGQAQPDDYETHHSLAPDTPNTLTVPVFAFGKVFAFGARPGPSFLLHNPLRTGRWTAAAGLALTALLTALVGVLTNQRATLTQRVEERTAELHASETSYHGLFNTIRQAIYIQDEQGRFVDVNDGAVAMYSYTREEFLGRTPEFLSAPGRNDLPVVLRCVQRAWAGEPQQFEFWGRRKNGEVFPKDVWLCRGTYFGQAVVIAVASDISERKRAEQERERAEADRDRLRDQLVQAQKMESIGRLAGGVAHDFNNMLQAILGNAALGLEETPPGHPTRECLEEIQKSGQRAADLTRQLLAFASRQAIRPRILDLNDTVSGMLKMLRRLIGEDIQLLWVPGSDLWPVKIDPSQLDQILANLTVNSRDAISGVGKVSISTANFVCRDEACMKQHTGCQPGDYVLLTVTDNGRGMDDEIRAHLFEPFYTTKERGKGTGLGLATVFGIVQQNKGFIAVETEPDRGTAMKIFLPRAPVPAEGQLPQEVTDKVRGGAETLLLVEDEGAVLRLGRKTLERLGYTVLAAPTPEEALRIARQHQGPLHLLVTDVILPGMNGRELALQLTALHPDMQCLFMSGYTADVIADRGVVDEKVNFIQKPFPLDTLAARIRTILNGGTPT